MPSHCEDPLYLMLPYARRFLAVDEADAVGSAPIHPEVGIAGALPTNRLAKRAVFRIIPGVSGYHVCMSER